MSKNINKKGASPILFHRKNTIKGQFWLQIITLCEGNGASMKTKEGRELHIHGLKRPGIAPDRSGASYFHLAYFISATSLLSESLGQGPFVSSCRHLWYSNRDIEHRV